MPLHFQEIRLRNENLRDKLLNLTGRGPVEAGTPASQSPQDADAIVAHVEINEFHGVGVLLRRMFGESPNVISIRSKDLYGGVQSFGAMHACIAHGGASRDTVTWNVLKVLAGATVRRVLTIPYYPDDVLNAIAIKEAFGAHLCTFLMDDQNLCSDGIPDSLMEELLRKSSLVLAISPEMCAGYEAKYNRKVWFMPPLAPSRLIPQRLNELSDVALRERQPIIFGNIWGKQWLDRLRSTVRGTGLTLRWHNNGEFRWLSCTKEELARDGIVLHEGPPDTDDTSVATLRNAPFVVVPSGTMDESDDRRFIAQLSFPSRIPHTLATSHTPILVLGSPETVAARTVTRLGIGAVAPYRPQEFLEASARLLRPDVNRAMRNAAFILSSRFSDLGATEWIWQSLQKGAPIDGRYQAMMPDPGQIFPDSAIRTRGFEPV